ncbi:hypothetical protein [Bradyrhizobium ottawaense]|uniref:hypothetical protein n=1 Tax=Bradyrhizobium ottawaense TaxID=931866 RepID=UPI00117808F8|nr:hypothetical protein [Bradyrhizobium ottawaense]
MIAIACRRMPAKAVAGMWAVGTEHGSDDWGGQDKNRKVRSVGWGEENRRIPMISQTLRTFPRNLHFSATYHRCSAFDTL